MECNLVGELNGKEPIAKSCSQSTQPRDPIHCRCSIYDKIAAVKAKNRRVGSAWGERLKKERQVINERIYLNGIEKQQCLLDNLFAIKGVQFSDLTPQLAKVLIGQMIIYLCLSTTSIDVLGICFYIFFKKSIRYFGWTFI